MLKPPQHQNQQTPSVVQWWVWFDEHDELIQELDILDAGGPMFENFQRAQDLPITTTGSKATLRRVLLVPPERADVPQPQRASTTRVTAADLRRADASRSSSASQRRDRFHPDTKQTRKHQLTAAAEPQPRGDQIMQRYFVQKLADDDQPLADVPGIRVTIAVPQLPAAGNSLHAILTWLSVNPNILSDMLTSLRTLIPTCAQPPKD